MHSKKTTISAKVFWTAQGKDVVFLFGFWKKFWDLELPTIFHWFVLLKAIVVNEWLWIPNSCSICVCGLALESIRHCLWIA